MARAKLAVVPRTPKADLTTAQAIVSHAEAVKLLAKAIDHNTAQRKGSDEFLDNANHRLEALCRFFRKRGMLLLASTPAVLTAIGAITPNAAHLLANALKATTGQ